MRLPTKFRTPPRKDRLAKYGLTPEQYLRMGRAQNWVCAICKRPPTNKRLNIDHEHARKPKDRIVRGLLCLRCNRFLVGRYKSQHAPLFTEAAKYLASRTDWRKAA